MTNKKTLVIGASLKPERYSNKAIHMLTESNINVLAIGLREGKVAGISILCKDVLCKDVLSKRLYTNIHTVTLYLNAKRQENYYDYIISLKPKRVIFNPGTENENFYKLLTKHNIDFEVACTLVLLRMKAF